MKLLLLIVLLAFVATSFADKKIVCYYSSWARYRPGDGKFTINDIRTDLCTHVVYSFVGITKDGHVRLLDDASDLHNFVNFIKQHPGVKAMVSIGGASENPGKFSHVANDDGLRGAFVNNAVAFLKQYNLDGLDVDWEAPNSGAGTKKSDKEAFVKLLNQLKGAFGNRYLLSAAVSAGTYSAEESYHVAAVAKAVDFLNVMTYDFNGSWNNYAGMNSPLYPSKKGNADQKELNVDTTIKYWLQHGAPAEKLIMGVPFYGRKYTLKDPGNNGLYAPISGPGIPAHYTQEAGYIGYNEICEHNLKHTWVHRFVDSQQVPFMFKGNQWISYDNPKSIRIKAEYINSHGLGGAMIWSIDTDEFKGKCGRKYVLLTTLHEVLRP